MAPYLYDALARGGKVLANGGTAGVTMPGALVVVPRFAREHPDAVARFLRIYLKALEWQRANPAAALAYFTAAGALKANPDPKTYVTDEYMKLAAGLDR